VDNTTELEISTEPVEPRQVRLTVGVPEERIQGEMRRLARRISQEVDIPGFRKGRAPYRIIAQRYGERRLREEVAEDLAEVVYREALQRQEIEPYGPATLEHMEIEPLRYTFTVPLSPVVDLGDYRSLRVKPRAVRVTKKEVEEALERLREENAVLEPREDRAAQPGDVLAFSVEGRTEEGEVFLKDEEAEMLLDPESERPVPGFHQALVGVKAGEERTFRLSMPEGSSFKEAEFTVQVKQVFERLLPGLDDDLARTVGPFESLEALRKHLREQIREEKRRKAEEEYVEQVIEALVDGARVEYPPQALEEEIDGLMAQFEERVHRNLRMSLEDYLKAVDKSEEALREELRPQAEERLRNGLVFAEFVTAEGIEVTEEEIEERIAAIRSALEDRGKGGRDWTPSDVERRRLKDDLLKEKIIARLTAIARGEVESEEKGA